MKTKIITILFLSVFVFGCKTESKEINNKVKDKVKKEVKQEEEHEHNHEKEALTLNNGQKWKVVDHMMTHIRNMESDFAGFDGKTVEEFQNLTDKLQANIKLLTSNCTMQGPAHDELHLWLVPYINLVKDFSKAKTAKEATVYYQKLNNEFKVFNQFFN